MDEKLEIRTIVGNTRDEFKKEIANVQDAMRSERSDALNHSFAMTKVEMKAAIFEEHEKQEKETVRVYNAVTEERVRHVEESEAILKKQLEEYLTTMKAEIAQLKTSLAGEHAPGLDTGFARVLNDDLNKLKVDSESKIRQLSEAIEVQGKESQDQKRAQFDVDKKVQQIGEMSARSESLDGSLQNAVQAIQAEVAAAKAAGTAGQTTATATTTVPTTTIPTGNARQPLFPQLQPGYQEQPRPQTYGIHTPITGNDSDGVQVVATTITRLHRRENTRGRTVSYLD